MANRPRRLHWVRQVQVLGAPSGDEGLATARERLIGALAERPLTVAQLAQRFGVSQPTMLEQVRRALRDGLIVEVEPPGSERRYPAERYYAPTVPVIRQADRDILQPACDAIAAEMATVVREHQADLLAAFEMTHLAREGWTVDDLWPYLQQTIFDRMRRDGVIGRAPATAPAHGLSWVEEVGPFESPTPVLDREEQIA